MIRVDGNGNSSSLIKVRGLNKTYKRGGEQIQVLQGLNLDADKGDFVAFMGPSGSGKTTLLNLLGGLDVPSAGSITVDSDEITHMSGSKLTQWRARHVGFIFQMYNLIPVLTAYQNVELPLLLTKLSKAERRKHVETALGVVNLTDRMHHYPRQLSGGQEQRVTIARAIVSDPTFLLCDEPTGDLDRKSADEIMALIDELVGKYNKTILMVTHDPVVAARAHTTLHLEKGVLIDRAGLIQTMPLAYRDKILQIRGVKAVTQNNWFGGVYQDEKNFFPQFVIDIENQRQVMTEMRVPDDQWKNFVNDRQGAVVGATLAKRFGWKIGDRIPLKNALYGPTKTWEFNIDDIYTNQYPGGDVSQFWLQWKYFDENVPAVIKGMIGWYVLKLDSPDDAVRVAKAIDTGFANSSTETKTETESAFQAGFAKQLGNIEFLILTIGGVVFFTLLLVTGNTMAISVRERTSELAVLKAIGFTDRFVLFFVLAESLVIALIGGLIGLGLAILAIPVVGAALNGLLPPLLLSVATLSLGLGIALLVGAASGLLPGVGAMRLRVVDALRRV